MLLVELHNFLFLYLCAFLPIMFSKIIDKILIEHNPVDVEAVFGISFGGKHLIKAVCWCVYNSFLCSKYPDSFHQSRTHTNHICGNVKNNRGLLSVCGTTIDLRSLFSVTTS